MKNSFLSEIEDVVLYLVLTYSVQHNCLHLGSNVGTTKVGRPRECTGQDARKGGKLKKKWQHTQREQVE